MTQPVDFNPKETLKKGSVAKKIGMDKLNTFSRDIEGFEIAEYNGGAKFRNGDTLLARITPCLENGKTAQVRVLADDEIGFGSTEFIVMREKSGFTDKNFIYYLAISNEFRNIAIKSMTGTTGRQRAQEDLIKDSIFNIPPLPEQKRIAEILSSLDDKIELNNQMNKTLEEMAQAIFKQWFVDFEFPNENGEPYKSSGGEMVESELGEIPKGWRVAGLDKIAEFLNGLAMQKYPPESEEEYLPVVKIKELRTGITADSDKASKNIDNKYIMSPKDLKTIDFLDKVLDSGVRVLKIEGRGRSAEYVKTVTRVYKEAVKAYFDGNFTQENKDKWNSELKSVYNRGFWDGYYLGQTVGQWTERYGSQATKIKEFIGTVTNYFKNIGVAEVRQETGELSIGDNIIIMGSTTGVYEDTIKEIRVDLKKVEKSVKGDMFSIPTKEIIRRGDKLYKIKDVEI